jgi:hypothetical protein
MRGEGNVIYFSALTKNFLKEISMSTKMPAMIAAGLTVLLLIIFAVLALGFEMVALNGASERQGLTAMSLSIVCHSAGAILLGILAWRSTTFMISKLKLNPILAVLFTAMLGFLAAGAVSFLSVMIAIPLAGIR